MIQDIGPYRLEERHIHGQQPDRESRILYFLDDRVLIQTDANNIFLPLKSDFGGTENFRYLFSIRSADTQEAPVDYFLYPDPEAGGTAESVIWPEERTFQMVGIRLLRNLSGKSGRNVFAIYTGWHLYRWYDAHRFCGRCGAKMMAYNTKRKLICPSCSMQVYPEIIPAVIVAVTDGNKILLTRNRRRPASYDSLIAGYMEVGETYEETVKREVMEETGLRVRNIRYYKSQPWGISQAVMAGFFCEVDGSVEIRIEKDELTKAVWTERAKVEPQIDDQSLTNEMMMAFHDGNA